MEQDSELKGNGNSYDFGARIYDPRVGRFSSIDPIFFNFPSLSSYTFAINSPIILIDRFGLAPDVGEKTIYGVITRGKPALSSRFVVNSSGRLAYSNAARTSIFMRTVKRNILAYLALELFIGHRMSPTESLYNTWFSPETDWDIATDPTYIKRYVETVGDNVYHVVNEVYTDDPRKLSPEYLKGVRERIANGKASPNDWKYAKEAYRRLKEQECEDVCEPPNNFDNDAETITFIQGTGANAKNVTAKIPEGFKKTSYKSHGQKVYTDGDVYISPDTDGHKGGTWKVAKKPDQLRSKDTRIGTYNEDLTEKVDN